MRKNILKDTYDFVFSLGEACPCSETIRSLNLQRIRRLYERIEHANKILIMYIENPITRSKTKKVKPLIMQCYEKIVQKFPNKEFRLAYLNN